jgi:hypothetical protein
MKILKNIVFSQLTSVIPKFYPKTHPLSKTPTNLSPAVAYQSGFGQWQDFWLDDSFGEFIFFLDTLSLFFYRLPRTGTYFQKFNKTAL